MAADRRQIEEAAASEQRRLGENLRAVANGALRTIESDTVATVARVRVMLLNAWLRPLLVGLSLFLGFSGGSWGLMHWLSTEIQSRIETLAALTVRIDQARETLVEIEDTTWGVTLLVIDGERFLVLPDGALEHSALDRGRAACLDAVERVRELYDRTRTAVDDSLADAVRAVQDGTAAAVRGAAAALRAGRSLAAARRAAGRGERDLAAAVRAARRANDRLGPGLRDARRDAARALEVMRQHGPMRDRDHGPSR